MTRSNVMDFYSQLEEKAFSDFEEMNLYATIRKVHMLQRDQPEYKQILQTVFEYGAASRNYDEHLKIGFWFAQIYNLHPTFSNLFSSFHQAFCAGAIQNILYNIAKLDDLVVLAARLIEFDQLQGLLIDLKKIANKPEQHSKQIIASLNLINQVIVWQMERKEIYLRGRKYQTLKMIKNVLELFKQIQELNQPKFIVEKIKLLHSIIRYFLSENTQKCMSEQILSFKTAIVEELAAYERIPLSSEEQDMFMDLVTDTITLFGIYDQTKLEMLISKYKYKTENISYLQLFKRISEHLTQTMVSRTKQTIQYIVQILISKVFQGQFKSFSQLYDILKTKSDIVIQLNKHTFANLTRYLQKCLEKVHFNFHQMFLSSLIIIYNPTVRTEVSKLITPAKQSVFYHNKHQKVYYQMIEYFASADINVMDYILDPQSREGLVWGLLALRNSIKVNYHFLSQNAYVPRIYSNLVKLMLANISSIECYQLASQLLHKNKNSEDKWKEELDYARIIIESRQVQFISPQALQNFTQLLKAHLKIFAKESFQNLQLFKQLCNLGTKMIGAIADQKQQLKGRCIQIFFRLLRTSLPTKNAHQIDESAIFQARDSFINLMAYDQKSALFPVYIDFVFTFRQSTVFPQLVAERRINNQEILQNIDSLVFRKWQAISIISRRMQPNLVDVEDVWPRITQGIKLRDKDLGLYFLQLNRYFLNSYRQKIEQKNEQLQNYRIFLRFQLIQLTSGLDLVYKQIQEQTLVSELQNVLQISIALNLNLTMVLTQINKYDEMKRSLQDKIVDLCHQHISKWLKTMQEICNVQFIQDEKGMNLELWCSSYTTLVVIACLSCQISRVSHLGINFSYSVMKMKLQSATSKLREKKLQQVQEFDLVFTQLFFYQLQNQVRASS